MPAAAFVADPPALPPAFREAVLAWYREHARPLAFRRTGDPYAILVSEAMAQQTQAARAAERWERFMARFPTVADLAAATPADVLREWRGLGYDRRGLNLWRAAREIQTRYRGHVPSDVATLEMLPGVGPYTARAVAAIAFGAPVGAVDTNVRRVLGRVVVGDPTSLAAGELQRIADAAVPADHPGAWTHALMDLGATVCMPRQPRCQDCPVRSWCAFAIGWTSTGASRVRPSSTQQRTARPFPSTSRWLRGRIMDRLRDAPGTDWLVVDAPIGEHDRTAVDQALAALAADGLIERDGAAARLRVA